MVRPECPSQNTRAIDESTFFSSHGINWTPHRIGWAVAGGCALLTVLLTIVNVFNHCRNYTNPAQQRQILRILYMPLVYAIISFLSYRFFREYTYFDLVEVSYEAVTLSAFILLLIEYVASTASDNDVRNAMERKEKRKLPFPLCSFRYRPTKPYFMYTVKWSVLQYVIIRPAVSIAGMICESYGVLCSTMFSVHYAQVYLSAIDFASISIALYGLIVFYGLTKDELAGKRPLAKFLAIKLIVMATFYQSFVFSALEGRVIHATTYWTATNIADGLNALTTCIEMVFFAAFMMWAYSWKEYLAPKGAKTSIWRPLWDSINFIDLALEIWGSIRFYLFASRRKPGGVESNIAGPGRKMDFGEAFGVYGPRVIGLDEAKSEGVPMRNSYDENIRLAPYTYQKVDVQDHGAEPLSAEHQHRKLEA